MNNNLVEEIRALEAQSQKRIEEARAQALSVTERARADAKVKTDRGLETARKAASDRINRTNAELERKVGQDIEDGRQEIAAYGELAEAHFSEAVRAVLQKVSGQ